MKIVFLIQEWFGGPDMEYFCCVAENLVAKSQRNVKLVV